MISNKENIEIGSKSYKCKKIVNLLRFEFCARPNIFPNRIDGDFMESKKMYECKFISMLDCSKFCHH